MLERFCEKLELSDLVIDGAREEWKQVNTIEGLEMFHDWYWVSNFGRVKSIGSRMGERILKQADSQGYLIIGLKKTNGKNKMMRVHRLVAFAFVDGYEDGLVVNHLDEQKKNNHYSNLEWCTIADNNIHGTRMKRLAEKQSFKVIGRCIKTGVTISFPSTQEAGRKGFSQGNVASCCRGERKTHKGYEWKYVKEDDV